MSDRPLIRYLVFALAAAVAACGEPEQATPEQDPTLAFPDCDEDDFAPFPFAGPGWDPDTGTIDPAQDRYVGHATLALVRPEASDRFLELGGAIIEAMPQQPGLIGFSVGMSAKCGTARTVGVWASEQAMFDFVVSEQHVVAIAEAADVAIMGVVTHFEIERADVPLSFERAADELTGGRAAY